MIAQISVRISRILVTIIHVKSSEALPESTSVGILLWHQKVVVAARLHILLCDRDFFHRILEMWYYY